MSSRNMKPWYIMIAVLMATALYVCAARESRAVEAEGGQYRKVTGTVEESGGAAVTAKVAPVQPYHYADVSKRITTGGIPMETPEEIAEEMYWDSMDMLSICVEAEAGNQGLEGKRLVADVILNRADDHSGTWADTIEEVITQPGQFSSYWDGGMNRVTEISEETYQAVGMETAERGYPGIYYFREGDWPKYGRRWKKVGDHYFAGK